MKNLSHLTRFLVAAAAIAGTATAQINFDPASSVGTGPSPEAATLGDFNGDGFMDLAVTSDNPDRVEVRFGNGTGAFGPAASIFTGAGTGAHTPVAGDLDGDLDVDIAVTLHNVNRVQVLLNNGAGGFTLGASANVGTEPRSLAIADLDGDSDLDLVSSNRDGNTVSVLLNQGGATFTVASYAAGQEPRELDVGDLSGDGVPDVAVAANDSRQVIVLRNLGNGTFVNGATLSVGAQLRPQGLAVADLNGDSQADIVTSTELNPGVEFASVFINLGGTTFSGPFNHALSASDASSLVAADMDLDGDMDVATANTDSGNINVLANDGTGDLGAPQVYAVGTSPSHIAAGRVDVGQSPDLVVTNTDSNTVSLFLNAASEILVYCTPGTSFSGCTASIGAAGVPSATAASGFTLSASGVEGNKDGLFFFGPNGRQANSWGNGTSFQCVVPPVKRAGLLIGTGTNGACNGSFSQDLNAHWSANPSKNPGVGAIVQAQLWYRDPQNTSNQTTSLSDAVEFAVFP